MSNSAIMYRIGHDRAGHGSAFSALENLAQTLWVCVGDNNVNKFTEIEGKLIQHNSIEEIYALGLYGLGLT